MSRSVWVARALVGVAVVAVGGLAACGGTGESPDVPASPVSASPSAAPVPTAKEIRPSETYASDEDAVRDVARLYFEALTEAKRTGDTSQMHWVASPDCVNCAEQFAVIDQRSDAGQRIDRSFYIYVTDVKVGPILEEYQVYPSLVTISAPDETVYDANGDVVESTPVLNETMHLVAIDTDQGWRIVEINHLTQDELDLRERDGSGYR